MEASKHTLKAQTVLLNNRERVEGFSVSSPGRQGIMPQTRDKRTIKDMSPVHTFFVLIGHPSAYGSPLAICPAVSPRLLTCAVYRTQYTSYFQLPYCFAYIANALVEPFHRQLKASLRAHGSPSHLSEHLHLVMLGIYAALKPDLVCFAAELVYGTTLRIPGDFFRYCESSANMDPSDYAQRLRHAMTHLRATAPRLSISRPFFPHPIAKFVPSSVSLYVGTSPGLSLLLPTALRSQPVY
nr:unnamed protein product [Spirometra erinaceieuropaei]